jgi:hypothetical protein
MTLFRGRLANIAAAADERRGGDELIWDDCERRLRLSGRMSNGWANKMGMTFREQLAAVTLGLVPGDQLAEIATGGLTEGYESSSLTALAGQSSCRYDSWECRRLWDTALDELGLPAPAPLEAAQLLVRACARMVIAGELTARGGAAMLVRVHQSIYEAASDSKYVGDSIGAAAIIGLFHQHDDCGFLDEATHRQIDREIFDEFQWIFSGPAARRNISERLRAPPAAERQALARDKRRSVDQSAEPHITRHLVTTRHQTALPRVLASRYAVRPNRRRRNSQFPQVSSSQSLADLPGAGVWRYAASAVGAIFWSAYCYRPKLFGQLPTVDFRPRSFGSIISTIPASEECSCAPPLR